MTGYRSALYVGRVGHRRFRPFHHSFSYRVFYLLLDIDELDRLDEELRWFSVSRRNLFSFDPALHGPGDGTSLRRWLESTLGAAGVDVRDARIQLLTFPRVLGYVFNPLSIWYCHDRDGRLQAVIHEVRNTFGDRHTYVVPLADEDLRHGFSKKLHVSPFNAMSQDYEFAMSPPDDHLSVSIRLSESASLILDAGLRLSRRPLTDGNLLRLLFTHPLVTLKVIAGIHWQALRLWIRGATFHPRPEPSTHHTTVSSPNRVDV